MKNYVNKDKVILFRFFNRNAYFASLAVASTVALLVHVFMHLYLHIGWVISQPLYSF